jgi:peptide chain release factor subunit 1
MEFPPAFDLSSRGSARIGSARWEVNWRPCDDKTEEAMITAEMIDRVIRFHGDGVPVVSAYFAVPVDPRERTGVQSRVRSQLHEIRPMTGDETLNRRARLSLRADLDRIENLAAEERHKPGTLAVFSCSDRDLLEEFGLPRTIHDRIVVDATPWVRPLLAVLDEYHRYCVAVVDKGSAQLWELYMDEMCEVARTRDRTLRKPNYAAGLAEDRVRNKADELSKRHFRKVAAQLDELFRTDGHELLIVGGHQEEIPAFLNFLPNDLRGKVAGTFTLDPGTATRADIRQNADAIVESYEREEERRMVTEVVEKVATGGFGALGLGPCLWAGSIAAVDSLLIQEGATAPGVICDRDGWLALSGDTCPLCGEPTRKTSDVIDELVEAVIEEGGSIEHALADTELKEHLVGAALRFPLPPNPTTWLNAGNGGP